MSLAAAIIAFIVGAVAGSFVAVLAYRLPFGTPVMLARSRCDHCARRLGPLDLIPLLSFVVLRGRCRTCRRAIGWQHVAIELAAAAIAVVAIAAAPGLPGAAAALLGWWLLLLAILDARHFWLPSALTLPLIAAGLGVTALLAPAALASHIAGAIIGFASLWFVAGAYRSLRGRDGLGGGDAKLFAASGAWLGWAALPTILAAAALLALITALIVWRGRIAATARLPFGVFLGAATWTAFLWRATVI